MAVIPLVGAALALSPIAGAVAALYGMGVAINDYLDRHIQDMKGSENPTVSRTGAVLEMAKFGFGVGYLTSVVVISAGQYPCTISASVTMPRNHRSRSAKCAVFK